MHLRIRLGTGQADVFVPEHVCVTGPTHVGAGESEVAGEQNDGFDVDQTKTDLINAESNVVIQSINYKRNILNMLSTTGQLLDERGVVVQ